MSELLSTLNSYEISEWMAYEITQTEEYQEKLKKEKELEESKALSDEQKLSAFRALLGVKVE